MVYKNRPNNRSDESANAARTTLSARSRRCKQAEVCAFFSVFASLHRRLRRLMGVLLTASMTVLPRGVWAQTADDYFHGGATNYVFGEKEKSKEEIVTGLQHFPSDPKLNGLFALLKKEEEQKQQQQQQQEQKNDQKKDQKQNQDSQKKNPDQKKDQQEKQKSDEQKKQEEKKKQEQ